MVVLDGFCVFLLTGELRVLIMVDDFALLWFLGF